MLTETSFSSPGLNGTGFHGISDPTRAFKREELVDDVLSKLDNRFVVVQSPPACGKSSLSVTVSMAQMRSAQLQGDVYLFRTKRGGPFRKIKACRD